MQQNGGGIYSPNAFKVNWSTTGGTGLDFNLAEGGNHPKHIQVSKRYDVIAQVVRVSVTGHIYIRIICL